MSSMIEFFERGDYKTGFFACHKDILRSLFAWFCTPLATGCLVGEMNDEEFNVPSCCCFPLGAYRARRMIQSFHVNKESEDSSMIAAVCCTCCSVAQDSREWKRLSDGTLPSTAPPPPPPPAAASPPQH